MNCCIKKRIKSDDVFLDFVPSSTSHIQRMPCPLTRFSSDVASPCEALHKGPPSKTARRNSGPTATNCRACFLCSLSPTPREFLAFTFLQSHWDTLAAIDFTIVEVWMPRGLVTFSFLFTLDLTARRIHFAGCVTNGGILKHYRRAA